MILGAQNALLYRVRAMGGSSIGHGGGARAPPPRFLEANVKSLIFTIGAPPDL